MIADARAEAHKLDMIRLCHHADDSRMLRSELLKRLRPVIAFEYAYFSTTDPATQLITHSVLAETPPPWLMARFVENEFLEEDFISFRSLLRAAVPVGILSASTGQQLHRSPRYRAMLLPLGMTDELRIVFVSEGACWGTLCLHRAKASVGYTAAEAAYLAQLAPHIADGLRRALLVERAAVLTTPEGPGVLLVADDLSIVATSPAADYWLAQVAESVGAARDALPLPVRSVVVQLKAVERGLATQSMPKVRMQTRSGQWLMIYAARLRSTMGEAHITVIFEKAQQAEIVPLIMQSYGLTRRECEITQSILLGWSTAQISARLHISSNTVQDHLKAIFGKVGVSSRGELAARIFTDWA